MLRLRLSGGPHAGAREWVLRTDSPSAVAASRPRTEEYALLRAARAAGTRVPEPLFLCEESEPLGAPFFLMRRVGGTAQAHRLVRSETLGGGREAVLAALGRELARIHSIASPRPDLPFLGSPPAAPALALVLRERLDALGRPQPVIEWDSARSSAIRHAAGGIGPRETFYRAYEAESGHTIDREAVRSWELMATLRWAVIALAQAERHLSGREPSLELALTGHIVPELEMDVLRLTAETS